MLRRLWHDYVWLKQTAVDLAKRHHRSRKWVQQQLHLIEINPLLDIKPQPIIVTADTVFFGRAYGVTVFREPRLKINLWWAETTAEKPEIYDYGRQYLEQRGFTVKAAVIDGKRGVKQVFADIPTQMCHFHQLAIVTRYLTRRPKLPAGQELKAIALTLTRTTEKKMAKDLNQWQAKWDKFLKERTINFETGRWFYTHRRLRSAYRSLKANFPRLFTYQKYIKLNIPNTTNSLEGSFTTLKNLLRLHRGMKRTNRYKMICEILKNNHNIL